VDLLAAIGVSDGDDILGRLGQGAQLLFSLLRDLQGALGALLYSQRRARLSLGRGFYNRVHAATLNLFIAQRV
jgi:hypothetical protein